jgi:hypothetical protein
VSTKKVEKVQSVQNDSKTRPASTKKNSRKFQGQITEGMEITEGMDITEEMEITEGIQITKECK